MVRAGRQAGRGQAAAPAARGLTVAGEVKNYVPVTDAMLRNPPPGDWLMARRNYQGWSYSPLNEITRDNVKDLKLAWVWAIRDQGGANQNMPLVHNGIIYLVNPGNVIQALDGRTGELIWENEVGPADADRHGLDAQHRDLRRQDDRRDHRRAPRRARRAQRQDRSGRRPIADRTQGLLEHQRTDRRARQGHPGPAGLRPLRSGPLLHQRLRRGDRQAAVEVLHDRAQPASRAATPGASCRTPSARAARPGLPAATIPIST